MLNSNLFPKIYPNPTGSLFNIDLESGNYLMSIYNAQGQVVLQKRLNGTEKIDVTTLKNGMYYIKIQDSNSSATFTQKLLKQD
jgi:hypothetical protein